VKIRLTIAAAALGVAAATMLGLAAAAPANADTAPPAQPAQPAQQTASPALSGSAPSVLVNFNSNDCLGILGGADDAPAVQWPCNGSPDQSWTLGSEYSDSAYFQIVNGDGQCLGVLGGSTGEGASVYGWTCLGPSHPDQYWTLLGSGTSGYSYLLNLNSGLVLGVLGNSTAQGASVVQWANQNTPNNQLWTPEATPSS